MKYIFIKYTLYNFFFENIKFRCFDIKYVDTTKIFYDTATGENKLLKSSKGPVDSALLTSRLKAILKRKTYHQQSLQVYLFCHHFHIRATIVLSEIKDLLQKKCEGRALCLFTHTLAPARYNVLENLLIRHLFDLLYIWPLSHTDSALVCFH